MASARITTDQPDLSPVLGELGADAEPLTEQLAAADEQLAGIVDTLNERGGNGFHSEGVVLEDHPWQPGRPPMVMSTDAWEVCGEVSVRFKTRVAGRPYTIQEQVFEIAEKRHETAKDAVEAFVAVRAELTELALSREPTLQGWKPQIPAAVGGPRIQ
jgi:hypothetical protein